MMSMRKVILLATALMSFCVVAEEYKWIGGSGSWFDPANWKDEKVPAAGTSDSVIFGNAEEITVAVVGDHAYAGSLIFTGANVTFTSSDSKYIYLSSPATVDVAEGVTVTFIGVQGRLNSGFIKTGNGVMVQTVNSGAFSSYTVAEGELQLATNADAFNPCVQVNVRSGARISTKTANQTQNNVVFILEDGAEFVVGQPDTLGGVFGSGVCSSAASTPLGVNFTLARGPWETSVLYSNVVVNLLGATESQSDEEKTKRRLTLMRGDSFRFARLGLPATDTQAKSDYVADTLQFGSGIGDFTVNAAVLLRTTGSLRLADTAGEPIRLHIDLHNTSCMPFEGEGVIDICNCDTVIGDAQFYGTIQADLFEAFTGELLVHRSNLLFGNLAYPESETRCVSLGGVKRIRVADIGVANGARITFAGKYDRTVDIPIIGVDGAKVDVHYEAGGGTCRFTDLDYDNYNSFIAYPGGVFEFGGDSHVFATFDNNYIKGNTASEAGLRVADNAWCHIGTVNMRYGNDSWQTNVVEIAGDGTFETASFSNASDGSAKGNTRIRFLGGTLSMYGDFERTIPAGVYPYHQVTVTNLPAKIRCEQTDLTKGIKLSAVLRPVVGEGESDGGIEKRGAGCLRVPEVQTELTGPVDVKAGNLITTTSTAGQTFGAGDVTLFASGLGFLGGQGVEKTVSQNGVLTYSGNSQILCTGASTAADVLTVGKSGSESSALVKTGESPLLYLRSDKTDYKVGANFKVKVNGGVALRENGLPRDAIVALAPATGFTRGYFSFVTYDETDGFKTLEPKAFAEAGEGDVAVLSAPATLTANAAVDSLSIGGTAFTSTPTTANSLNLGGFTLALGDGTNPALVLVNCYTKEMYPLYNGTVAFGTSRGYILAAGANNNIRNTAKFTGSNGLVYAGVGDAPNTIWIENGSHEYTGGTWIENVRVIPRNGTGFGPANADVYSLGTDATGGTLYFDASYATDMSRDYRWHLSGYGVHESTTSYGALHIARPDGMTLTGTMELQGETLVKVTDGVGGTLKTPISGSGKLVKGGLGRLILEADNTGWNGGVWIKEGTVRVSDPKQLGGGAIRIEKSAALVFCNETEIVVTNKIAGGGEIRFTGAAVALTDDAAFYGVRNALTMPGVDADGNTSVSGYFDGTITGEDVSFLKTDDGVTMLANTNTYGGSTTVAAGTLVLGDDGEELAQAIIDTAFCHLDATQSGTVVLKEGTATGEVESWKDIKGRYTFTQTCTIAGAENPVYHEDGAGMNGKSTVFFTGFKNRLLTTGLPSFKTFLFVHRVPSGKHPKSWSCAGVFGISGSDSGIRVQSGSNSSVRWFSDRGYFYVDGVEQLTMPYDRMLVSANIVPTAFGNVNGMVIGDYWGIAAQNRCYWGDIGEILLFTDALNTTQRHLVEKSLQAKWSAEDVSSPTNNILPETTDLTVRAGATLDLNGCDQTVASLAGGGTIINTADRAVTLTVTGDCAFFGALADNVKLVIAPAGEGAVGTCTVSSAAVLAGATFLCDVLGTEADRIDFVGGDFDVSTVALTVSASASATPLKAPVLTTVGELSGTFKSAACPPTLKLKYRYDDRAVVVDAVRGVLLIVR